MSDTDNVEKHPALVKQERRDAASLAARLDLARRRAFAPLGPYELERRILDLRLRVEALEAERKPRRRRP